jgi:hypothetical protein
MTLKSNGQLLIKVGATPTLLAAAGPPFAGYSLAPLLPTGGAASALALAPIDDWLIARPAIEGLVAQSPWDQAHDAAASAGYQHYVEPDILHEIAPPSGQFDGQGMDPAWPPAAAVSPGWHLATGFTGFADVRGVATGAGVRICHLDTGYTPGHASKPAHLQPQLGYDYVLNIPDAVDPGGSGPFVNAGHGTATLAVLAAGVLDLPVGSEHFSGLFGGAPDADVVPVRISESVIHLYTSTMAQGLAHALAPNGDAAQRCDVVTISHGGLPTQAWADQVNKLYDAGVVVVAASGDSIYLVVADIATRYTVYPSAFDRVITALGATYAKGPYVTDKAGEMQGCWGPDDVMDKAAAAYTPNVAWMNYKVLPAGFGMNGSGTSASTPQIAAACALWLQLYKNRFPQADWRRVEACRLALFDSADAGAHNKAELGWGVLRVPLMLSAEIAEAAIAKAQKPLPADQVSFPFWRLLLGFGPPQSAADRMYETEVAQTVLQSQNQDLRAIARRAAAGQSTPQDKADGQAMLLAEGVSTALAEKLKQGP